MLKTDKKERAEDWNSMKKNRKVVFAEQKSI